MGAKVKSLIKEKLPSIILFILMDFFMLLIATKLSILVRFDFSNVPELYMNNSQKFIILDFIILFVTYSVLKLYTSVWKYASVIELIDIILSNIAFIVITSIYKSIFLIKLPISFYLIEFFLLVMLTCITRLGYRVIRTLYIKIKNRKNSKKTMLIGAGDAGRMIIDEIYNNAEAFDSKIVCVIDDNKGKVGHYIKGFKIEGSTKDIERLAKKHEIEEIIIAIPSASKERIDKIVTECHKVECEIKILPSIYMQMEENEKVSPMSQIRPLSYEDFLGRDQIVVDDTQIKNDLNGKVILVTGGGGSIGSELCRQIAKANPKTLIIFDIYENNAYDIQQELLTAHKHVPLMEVSPYEAIKNNSFGTLNTVKLADKYKVKKFVLISTDKAVRPTNVMGASKRICEMIVQTYDKISKNTDYVAVRFGNVLGSNGSVIPLFLKQIENGGPVTVTDEKMERFFMTIPEAVSLVLQAGCYAKGGEIFVLDMGKPVRIKALAEKLIRYKGLEPNKDIEIKITGLRPGEKLYEERLMEEEGMQTTPNKLISIGKPLNIPESFLHDLDNLIKSAYNNDDEIKDKVAKIVTTYKVDKERIGK